MSQAGDREIWEFARNEGFVVVSKDSNFRQLAVLDGPPPEFVWVRLGNCSVADTERVLSSRREELEGFEAGPEAFLVLGVAL